MCGIKCLNVGQFGRLQSYMGSRTSRWTLNTAHAEVMEVMASFGEFLPRPQRKLHPRGGQFMGSFPAGFPFSFWNFFTEVKLKSNSFNSCTIYVTPQLCSAQPCKWRRHSTTAQRLSCAPHSVPHSCSQPLLGPSQRRWGKLCRSLQKELSLCEELWKGKYWDSNSPVCTARSVPSPLRPCLPAYPEKSIAKKDGHAVLPNTTQHEVWNR